ncbi:CopD family protein [Iamia majanohamensis]|uniref:CopD family protein n=1 Tax=Iamia majanohamensis TaxID=467976 RepID=A0AAE9Y802_9ACTN|nr:CopD family protein [Iamia majanohamensis]WCO68479.1 CopD family protein [Iamia majanohamensis]
MLADIGSFPYNVMLLLHLLAVLVAFAPAFVWPVLRVTMRKQGGDALPGEVGRQIAPTGLLVHGPALVAAGIFGILTLLLSGDVYQFSDTWVSIAFVLWFLMLGVLFLGIIPADRKAAEPSETPGADARASMFNGMLHLLIVLMLIVMIWKPS